MQWVLDQRCKSLVEFNLICHHEDQVDWVTDQVIQLAKKGGVIASAIVHPSNWIPNDKMDLIVGGLFVVGYVAVGVLLIRFAGPPGIALGGAMVFPGPMYGTMFFAGVWTSNVIQEVLD